MQCLFQKNQNKSQKLFRHKNWTWVTAYNIVEIQTALAKWPEAKLIAGATSLSKFHEYLLSFF